MRKETILALAYGAGEIKASLCEGHYPLTSIDYEDLNNKILGRLAESGLMRRS